MSELLAQSPRPKATCARCSGDTCVNRQPFLRKAQILAAAKWLVLGALAGSAVTASAGELAPEAEVVALEALAGRGERAALEARAARFLARYPADPHAARVRALVQR